MAFETIEFKGYGKPLVWKYPEEKFNTKSQLIVQESQEAILYRNGQSFDRFGFGRHTLATQNIPILNKVINIPDGKDSSFHCEIYFINKSVSLDVKWGTPVKFQVLDSTFNVLLNVGISGSMEFKIKDSKKFLTEVIGTQNKLDTIQIIPYFRGKVVAKVKSYLTKAMSHLSYLVINQYLEDFSEAIKEKLVNDFNVYGVNLINFYLYNIIVPEEQIKKVRSELNKKLEIGILNYAWADEQIAEISKKYVSNHGMRNNVGGATAQSSTAFREILKGGIPEKSFNSNIGHGQTENGTKKNTKFCSECGNPLDDNLKCNSCGAKFTLDENNNLDKILSFKEGLTDNKSLQNYEEYINALKSRYQNKEDNARKIIKEYFPPPQMTYDRFMGEIDKWNVSFTKQSNAILNILDIDLVDMTSEHVKKVENELRKKLDILKSIVTKMEELVVELVLNVANSSEKSVVGEVEDLLDEMQKVVDSVKEYK
jgi:membrane protease subunit (stomatin/prohibitin family)